MGALSPFHLIIILVIALLVIGPGKLPEVGSALGKAIREFRSAASDVQDVVKPPPAAPPVPTPVAPVATAQAVIASAAVLPESTVRAADPSDAAKV